MPSGRDTTTKVTKKFWYQGYYYLIAVENKFLDGQFTQDISMLSLPQDPILEVKEKKESKGKTKVEPTTKPSAPQPNNAAKQPAKNMLVLTKGESGVPEPRKGD